jgi:hypothetical protein
MIRRWLCGLKWHKWSAWCEPWTAYMYYKKQSRSCKVCNLWQERYL